VIVGHFLDLGKAINSSQTTIGELMDPHTGDLFQYFIDNAQSLNSRNLTYGSPSAGGGNVGTGGIIRLTTNRNSQAIETTSLVAKAIECTQDANTGTSSQEEVFSLSYDNTQKDNIDALIFSPETSLTVSSPENSLIVNGSFEEIDGAVGAGNLNTIFGWDIATGLITDFEYDSTNYYASSKTELDQGTSYALKMKANSKITQNLRTNGTNLDLNSPYIFLLYWNRQVGGADGTLTIRMGAATTNVVFAAQAGWNQLALTANQNLWYENFKENDLNIEVEWSGMTVGTLLIDWVIFDSMTYFDGTYYMAYPGVTPFEIGDVFNWTDSLTVVEGKIQYWLQRQTGLYLPHNNAGAETITDP